MGECSLDFISISDRPFVFLVGEGLFFQQLKTVFFLNKVEAFYYFL